MALRELALILGVEVDSKDAKRAQSTFDAIRTGGQLALGAIGIGAVAGGFRDLAKGAIDLVRGVGELGDDIRTTSERLRVGTGDLQELRFAALGADVATGELDIGLRTLSNTAADAASGNKNLAARYRQLGVSVKDSNGNLKSARQIMGEVADGLGRVENDTLKVSIAQDIFGRSGTALLPLLAKGSAGLEEAAARARELGFVLDGDALRATDNYDVAQTELNATVAALRNQIGIRLLPALTKTIRFTQSLAESLAKRVKPAADVLGRVLQFFGRVLSGLVQAFDYLTSREGRVVGMLSAIAAGLALAQLNFVRLAATVVGNAIRVAAAWIVMNAPLILMGLLLAAIGAAILLVIEDLVALGEGGDSFIGTLIEGFSDLVDEFGSIPAAIWEALKTAGQFWFDWFASITQGFRDMVAGFLEPLTSLAGKAREQLGRFGLGGLLGSGGSAAAAVSPAPGSGGGSSVSASGVSNVEVKVDARGATDPAAVGRATGVAVAAASDGAARQIASAYKTIAPRT